MELPKIVRELWDKYNLPENVRRHCIKVAEVAFKIAESHEVDPKILLYGALLHDIGRSVTHAMEHFIYTGEILRKEDMEEKIVRVAERHFACGATKEELNKLGIAADRDYMPETIEEKIVCMADNLVKGEEEVTFEDFIERIKEIKAKRPDTAWFANITIRRAYKLKEELGL